MPEIVNPSPEFLAEQEKRLREWEEENYKQLKDYFDKKDDPLGDDSEQVKAIVSGVLTIAALAVYLTGPAGTAIGVALSTSAAIATAFQKPKANDDVNTVLESIKTLQKNEKIMKHMGATDAFYKWVRDNQHILNSVEHHQEASMKELLTTLNTTWTDPQGVLYMSTIPSATSDVQWENTAVRLAALGCASAFVAAHALKCRIYAWLAINARAQGNSEAYESHKASFNSACQTMDNSVKTKQDDMEKLLGQVRESRKSKILGPTFDKKGQLWPSGLYTVGCNLETQRKIGNYLSWFVEDSVTGRYGTWPQQKWYPQTFLGFKLTAILETEPPKEALEALDRIRSSAHYYCYMAARPTRAVMESWNVACQDSKTYIYPGMKTDHKPEKIREETVTLIHPWLKDAEKVAWAYKLRTADGTSKMSGWSDEFAVPDTGAVSLPVFRLDNFGFRIATERVVYHKKLVRGTTKWVGDGSEGNDLVEARVIKEDIFVDCMPDL